MTITYQLSDDLSIELEGEVEWEDDSFSYSYGSIDATQRYNPYLVCTNITWDKSLYSDQVNQRIQQEVNENYKDIAKEICQQAMDLMDDY